jgi:succinoglycan biosynthesis transport protein ExoP
VDTRVRGTADVEHVTGLPVLGEIAYDRDARRHPLLLGRSGQGPRTEAFRSLRSNLQFLPIKGRSRSIVVTSSIEGEGKSTSVGNLAIVLADAGRSVVLVDGDLRRPSVAEYFGIDGTVGVTDVLIGRTPLQAALQVWGERNLHILPAGALPPNPSELIQSDAMIELVLRLEEQFDVVLFDAPPLLPVSDAAVLARQTSGAILVAAARRARRPGLVAAMNTLARAETTVLGVVVTMLPSRGPEARGYGYGSHHYGPEAGMHPERGAGPALGRPVEPGF